MVRRLAAAAAPSLKSFCPAANAWAGWMDRPIAFPISSPKATMKLGNLPVGLRLGLAFGAILVITALIAAMGMWRISSL